MFDVDLSIGECGGRVVVGLRGELTEAFHVHPNVDEAADDAARARLSGASGTSGAAPLLRGPSAAAAGEARRSRREHREAGAPAVTAVLPAGSPDIHQPPSARPHCPRPWRRASAAKDPPSSRRFAHRSKEPRMTITAWIFLGPGAAQLSRRRACP